VRYPNGLKDEAKIAAALGWTLVLGGTGHMKWYDTSGALKLVTSMTPKRHGRGILNAKAQLKRAGVKA
jgi:hypothetical protein